jgi:6-hydroxytryprostatin B O-methyltransferase
LAFNTNDNLFKFLKKNPEESRRFNSVISLLAAPSPVLAHMKTSFLWSDLAVGGMVIDVGGGSGSVSTHLAEAFDHLQFVVQDLPDAVAGEAE